VLPPLAEGQVRVRCCYSAISRGTETLVFRGEVPESQYQAMRCPFQEGDFPAPVKYGYSAVGVVEDGPAPLAGQRVFVLHPHQDRFDVPADAAVPVPAAVPSGRAVLAANMETALNALWDAGIGPGDRVCVIGGGVVGLLCAALAVRMPGTEVLLADPDPAKADAAARLGIPFVPRIDGLEDADFDIIIHASGNPDGLATALTLAGFESLIVELSWFGEQPVCLPLGEAFHSRRLTLRSSQVGSVAPSRRPRWSHRRRLAKALALLDDPRLDALISGESAFADLPQVMADLAGGRLPALCHRIRYQPDGG
jgi:NADPH:quinone reductase-like Zn-dependent oxidoreductase